MLTRLTWEDKLGFAEEEAQSQAERDLIAQQIQEQLEAEVAIETVQEVSVDSTEVFNLARGDLDFLAALALPVVFQYCFPPVFKSVWQWLLSYVHKHRDFSKLALGLPRGFGKTTLIKIYILYCILFTKKKFILVISSTSTLAENILADVIDMLNEPNIQKIFGDWRLGIEKDTLGLKKFGFRGRNIILAGIGAGTSLRGMNLKHERPDVMIFEDFQTREDADSIVTSNKLLQWMLGTAMKAKSPHGCQYIFVANMYPTKTSILRKLKSDRNWIKFIAGGIITDVTGEAGSLWEELQPLNQLLDEFQTDLDSGHPEIFYSEVLNDENASVNQAIDMEKIPVYPYPEFDIPTGNFIIIDPARDKVKSDDTSIGYFETHDNIPVCKEIEADILSPGDTILRALKMALRNNCRCIAIESNGYQGSLKYWFDFTMLQYSLTGIEAVEIFSGSESKNSRILGMFRKLLAGEVVIHPKVLGMCALQIMQFNPLKKDNEDGILDLLTYAPRVVEMFGEYIMSLSIINQQQYDSVGVEEFNSPF